MVTPRALVLYDFLETTGGAERVSTQLSESLGATLVVGYCRENSLRPDGVSVRELTSWRRPKYVRLLRVIVAFMKWRPPTDSDFAIVSGIYAVFGIPRLTRNHRVAYYCHTPPRFCFEDFDRYFGHHGPFGQRVARMLTKVFAKAFARSVGKAHAIFSNSKYTQQRLFDQCGLRSEVLYPPSLGVKIKPKTRRTVYLSCARHEPYKRVDLIVRAFLELPESELIVASSGSQTEALRAIAVDAGNIRFVGRVDDPELSRLLGESIALIYIPQGEDFGMSPVEAMRHGTPVIGAAEGGLLEIIEEGVTGMFVEPTVDAIRQAVTTLNADRQVGMAADCSRNAAKFEAADFSRTLLKPLMRNEQAVAIHGQ
jgi:glycosyltransferase involved in cell wall biosynthesis